MRRYGRIRDARVLAARRAAIRVRLARGETFTAIGRTYQISRQHVQQIAVRLGLKGQGHRIQAEYWYWRAQDRASYLAWLAFPCLVCRTPVARWRNHQPSLTCSSACARENSRTSKYRWRDPVWRQRLQITHAESTWKHRARRSLSDVRHAARVLGKSVPNRKKA